MVVDKVFSNCCEPVIFSLYLSILAVWLTSKYLIMAAQLPDTIIINKEKMGLYSNPLEQFWIRLNKRRPSFCPLDSCQRGYVATWEIKDKQLFLKEIDGNFVKKSLLFGKRIVRYSMKMLFSKSASRKVKASWYSGKLRIPQGNMTAYDHQDYNSRFEKEMIVTVDRGNVIKMVTLDYTQHMLIVN